MKRRNVALTLFLAFVIVLMIVLSLMFNEGVGLVGVFRLALGWR